MKALLFENFQGRIEIRQVPDPVPPPDGVVIRVKASGICRSDWHGWMGHDPDVKVPHVPGHEFAGVIEETGAGVRRWKPGDRVTVPFAVGCGICQQCLSGHQHICDDYFQPGFTAWGSFAELVAIPHADTNLVRLPDELGFVDSASLGCRFVTSFRAVVSQGRVSAGEWVTVHGCGGVGLSAIMIARGLGARVIGVDVRAEALAYARKLGAAHVLDAAAEPRIAEAIRDMTEGGAHVSIDALGSRATCRNSVECLRKQGRHVQVGLMLGEDSNAPIPMNLVIARELEMLGSHGIPAHEYGKRYRVLDPLRPVLYHPNDRAAHGVASPDGFMATAEPSKARPVDEPLASPGLISNDATNIYQLPDGSFEMYSVGLIKVPASDPSYVAEDNAPGWLRVIDRYTSLDGLHFENRKRVIHRDENDPLDQQFYYLAATHTPKGRVGMLGHYRCRAQTMDLEWCFSSDGIRWSRPLRRAWLPRGEPPAADCFGIYGGSSLVRHQNKWHLFYTGVNSSHNGRQTFGPPRQVILYATAESIWV